MSKSTVSHTTSMRALPSVADVRELSSFLAANADVATADGEHVKAAHYRQMIETVKALSDRATDLSAVTRVVVVGESPVGRAFEKHDLYSHGCVLIVQDDGRTLKLLPAATADESL